MSYYPQELFCDETGQHGGPEWYLGAIRCSVARSQILSKQLFAVREKWRLTREMKWTKVSDHFVDAYREWVDVFLDDLHCRLSVMRVPREELDGREEEQFIEAYRQFFFHTVYPQCRFHVYADDGAVHRRYLWESLHYRVNKLKRDHCGVRGRNIATLHVVNSAESDMMQLTDVILGAVVSHATAAAKHALAEHVALRVDAIDGSSPYRTRKIQEFEYRPRRALKYMGGKS